MRRFLLLLVLAHFAFGCGDGEAEPTEPIDPVDGAQALEIAYSQVEATVDIEANATGGDKSIIVTGVIETRHAGYELYAQLGSAPAGDPTDYVVEIHMRSVSGGVTVPIRYSYEATLRDVPTGVASGRVMYVPWEPLHRPWRTMAETSVSVFG